MSYFKVGKVFWCVAAISHISIHICYLFPSHSRREMNSKSNNDYILCTVVVVQFFFTVQYKDTSMHNCTCPCQIIIGASQKYFWVAGFQDHLDFLQRNDRANHLQFDPKGSRPSLRATALIDTYRARRLSLQYCRIASGGLIHPDMHSCPQKTSCHFIEGFFL